MKKLILNIGWIILIFGSLSCTKDDSKVVFKDQDKYTIYSYIAANKQDFSTFLNMLQIAKIDRILSAYNSVKDAQGFTLFLPTNEAIEKFVQQSGKYASLNEFLSDTEYVTAFCKYHVLNTAYKTDNFPFGAFDKETLSGDKLTVSFISETDTSYYKINNQAPVISQNIEVSNGYIHVVSYPLKPIVYTSYYWLEQNPGFSIFKAAVDLTGLKSLLELNIKDQSATISAFTLLLEHDSIYNKRKIYNIQDLINFISPDNNDYTNPLNPLYNFVAYHVLVGEYFLNDFEKTNSNYSTYSDVPLRIIDNTSFITINLNREVFDTIINGLDTTIINYISFNYDASNVLTQSGVIHFIDQVMTQKSPTIAEQNYSFNEPLFAKFNTVPGAHRIEDSTALKNIKYSGADLFFVTGETSSTAWNKDYLMINGDFTISYTIPKLVQGEYEIFLRAESSTETNAVIQMYIDGKAIGGLINLGTGGTSYDAFRRQESNGNEQPIGKFKFIKYESHTIFIKSLIPGRFLWDVIQFKPVK
jgi:uncharacterized surface protein with fasciclin (FAS1) repeats